MAQQIVDIGAAPNDGTGDPIRVGGQKINDNFTELYGRVDDVDDKLSYIRILTDFGAVPDGVTDSTAAIQAAIDDIPARGGSIYVPAGKYLYSSNVVMTSKGVSWYGDGSDVSEFIVSNNAEFRYEGGTPAEYDSKQLTLRDLSWRTNNQHTGNVINVIYTGGVGSTAMTFIGQNLEITGTNGNNGFLNAINLNNARNVRLSNIRIMGDRNAGSSMVSSTGIKFFGDSSPVELFIDRCTSYFVQTAVSASGTSEGIYITQSAFIACNYGFVGTPTGPSPLVNILGCHMNTYVAGVLFDGFVQFNFSNNLLYGFANPSDYVAMQIEMPYAAGFNSIISDNTFAADATVAVPAKNGIAIQSSPTGPDTILITDNVFLDFDTAIILGADANGVRITSGNQYNVVTTSVSDSGTDNIWSRLEPAVNTGSADDLAYYDVTGVLTIAGSAAINLDASGNAAFAMFRTFPNRFKTAVVCSGDATVTGGDATFSVNNASCTTSALNISVRPNPGAVAVRINYIAYGD